ncbi:antirestriction protein ArdA [bacterium]|nr:antirestriction protein ArdA [bacterium]
MTRLYAQPYDISASGFFFESVEEYQSKRQQCRNDYGAPVEEFEIQFIDGEDMDADLFKSLRVHQGDFDAFLQVCEDWSDDQKIRVIIAVGECGYRFDPRTGDPEDFDIDLYEMDSLRELAYHFVEEGLFGDIPERIHCYLDYDAIARDLSMDYSETSIGGQNLIYRCG